MIPSSVPTSVALAANAQHPLHLPLRPGPVVRLERKERLAVAAAVLRERADGVQRGLDHRDEIPFAGLVVHRELDLIQAVLAGQAVLKTSAGDVDQPARQRDHAEDEADGDDQQDVGEGEPPRDGSSARAGRPWRGRDPRSVCRGRFGDAEMTELGDQHGEHHAGHEQPDQQQQDVARTHPHVQPPAHSSRTAPIANSAMITASRRAVNAIVVCRRRTST